MIPCTYPKIVRIDTETDDISYYDDWNSGKQFSFRKSIEIDKNFFYAPSAVNGYVLEFDMEKCKGRLRSVGQGNQGSWGICKAKGFFWLSPQWKGPIIKWNVETGDIYEIEGYPEEFKGDRLNFTKVYECKGWVYLVPGLANMGIMVSPEQNVIRKTDIPELQNVKETLLMFEMNNNLYLKVTNDDGVKDIVLDMRDNTVTSFSFYLTKGEEKFKKDYSNGMHKETGKMKEDMGWNLKDFLQYI